MPKKDKDAANETVKVQLDNLANALAEVKAEREQFEQENKLLKRQLQEANLVIENDLRADLMQRIIGNSAYTSQDLQGLEIQALQQIDSTLAMAAKPGTSKNIRTGLAADAQSGRDTVGDLYGKTREQILKMED